VTPAQHPPGRLKDALTQVQRIIQVRFDMAKRPHDPATQGMMLEEIREVRRAQLHGDAEDKRSACLALAATLIILAEQDDRPAPPPEGQRARAARRAVDLSIRGDLPRVKASRAGRLTA
jgi:hypothetical protein